jgi:hypothetical protein
MFVNFTYQIKKIKKQSVVLVDPFDKTNEYYVTHDSLSANFKLPYASTCHSYQGLSTDDKITIFDCNTPYVDRYFIWTSLTRSTNLKNVQLFKHSESETTGMVEFKIRKYLLNKIEGYKTQDAKCNREYKEEDYVNLNWIGSELAKLKDRKCCKCCSKPYETRLNEYNNVISNLTVDRIDNTLAHVIGNIQLMCLDCNRTKK